MKAARAVRRSPDPDFRPLPRHACHPGRVNPARTLVLVVAHPDDDAYAMGGTVALHDADPEFRFVLVHATDGSGGDIPPGFPATRETLGSIRRAECEAAWRVARSGARSSRVARHRGRGELDQVPFDDLVETIATILDEEEPAVVSTFGPDGITGHPDHITIGAATDAAFMRFAGSGRNGFKRLLHGALPQSIFERLNEVRVAGGDRRTSRAEMYHLRGVPDDQVGLVVDCRPVADRIVAGLLEHRSQLHVMADDPTDTARWARLVSREWSIVAWPPRPPGCADAHRRVRGLCGLAYGGRTDRGRPTAPPRLCRTAC